MRFWFHIGLVVFAWAQVAPGVDVVSNAMSGVTHSNLASAVAAAANGDELVMIGDETLGATLVVSNRVLSIVSDGAVRTIRGSAGCAYDMVYVAGTNASLTLGKAGGSDEAPTLVFDGGKNAGVSNLYDMFSLSESTLRMHPGVVLRNLASVDCGAVYNVLGVFEMLGGRIEGNSAPYGGGIFNNMGEVRMSGGSLTGNVANVGGGVYNQAVEIQYGYIVGYPGGMEMSGGAIAKNVANQSGGGIYSMGALEMTGGRVERNAAGAGGGVVHFNGTTHGLVLRGSVVVASNTATAGSGIYYNNDAYTWLTIAEGGRVEPPNDVFMATNVNPLVLSGALAGRGTAAQLTPPTYSTNQQVLGTVGGSNLWVVSNYYGKFTVTPESTNGPVWFVGSDGRLCHVDPAGLPAALGAPDWTGGEVGMDVEPAYVAWDGVLDFATNLVDRAWVFQPVPTNAYAVTHGRVVLSPEAPSGVFRMRRK